MTENIRLEGPDADGVAVIWFDSVGKSVNTLSVSLMPEFDALLDRVINDGSIKAVVLASAKKSGFIAGADIEDLDTVSTAADGAALSRKGQMVMDRMAHLGKPGVAAIHGDCLGGGLEVALSCDARVASNDPKTKMALPEVMLGLLPGAGGTVRLPKLIGLANALDMMLTGKNIRPRRALKMGLVDDVVPPNQLLRAAKKLALKLVSGKKSSGPKKKFAAKATDAFVDHTPFGRNMALTKAREMVMKQTHGLYPAPLKILSVVESGTFEAEAQGFGELLVSPESAGLRHLFWCITSLKKDDGPGTADVEAREVNHVGMLGGGLMGAGIATVLADKDKTVRVKDIRWEAVQGAYKYADRVFGKAAKRKKYSREEADMRRNRISGGLDWAGMATADVIIEAVPEILDLKKQQIAEIEKRTKRDAIFATNTSALPITEIAEGAKHPERIIGMHFFSPVEKMPLVEVITTAKTDPAVTKTISQLARTMGKHVIVVNDGPGFYTTRALAPYMTEAMHLALQGYDPLDIDEAATRVGFPVGPITLLDEVGIDVGAKVTGTMQKYFGERMEFPDDTATKAFLEEGRVGKKASKGFYVYEDGKSKMNKAGRKIVDPGVRKHLPSIVEERTPEWDVMSDRLVLSLLNEAVHCLHDGVLNDPHSGDLGAVFGIGFPPMSGGPFRYADTRGIGACVERLNELAEKFGPRFKPCELLVTMAKDGTTFYGGKAKDEAAA